MAFLNEIKETAKSKSFVLTERERGINFNSYIGRTCTSGSKTNVFTVSSVNLHSPRIHSTLLIYHCCH